MVQVIMAMNEKGGMGYKNRLPWNCKEELALFKKKTMGKTIVIGKNTGIHLPNLSGRNVVCISRNPNSVNTSEWNNKVLVVGSDWLNTIGSDVMIAGGGEIYRTVFEKQSFVKKVHLSVIKGDHECDVYFNIELLKNFVIVEKIDIVILNVFILLISDKVQKR